MARFQKNGDYNNSFCLFRIRGTFNLYIKKISMSLSLCFYILVRMIIVVFSALKTKDIVRNCIYL